MTPRWRRLAEYAPPPTHTTPGPGRRWSGRLKPREKIDTVLLRGWLLGLLALLLAGGLVIAAASAQGWFQSDAVRAVPDDRKLVNIRENLDEKRFLDATVDADNQLLVSKSGGEIHRYNPATQLWDNETPLLIGLNGPDFTELRTGNGEGPRASFGGFANGTVPVWARTPTGGLAVRSGPGEWDCVLGNQSLGLGAVSSSDLTASAASPDGRYVAYGTRRAGLTIQDTKTKAWYPFTEFKHSPVGHIRWFDDAFWAAAGSGLHVIGISEKRGRTQFPASIPPGTIIGLDVGFGAVYALVKTPPGGRVLVRYDTSTPRNGLVPGHVHLNQGAPAPDRDLKGFHFAQQQGDKLWLAGDRGLVSYDVNTHFWETHHNSPIFTVVDNPDEEVILAGTANGLLQVRQGSYTTSEFTRDPVRSLALNQGGNGLVLTTGNRLYHTKGRKPVEWFPDRTSDLDPGSAQRVFANGDDVHFVSPTGWIRHNVADRSYEVRKKPPNWMSSDLRFVTNKQIVYALDIGKGRLGRIHSHTLNETGGNNRMRTDEVNDSSINHPPEQAIPWARGIALRFPDNRVATVDEKGFMLQVQSAAKRWGPDAAFTPAALDAGRFVDVAEHQGLLYFASPDRVHAYDTRTRDWVAASDQIQSDTLTRILADDQQLVTLDDKGGLRLTTPTTPYDAIIPGRHHTVKFIHTLSGLPKTGMDSLRFTIPQDQIVDAANVDDYLTICGPNRCEVYSHTKRHVIERYDYKTVAKPVIIHSARHPIILAGGVLWEGTKKIAGDPAQPIVHTFRHKKMLWWVEDHGSHRVLRRNDNRAWFTQPPPPAVAPDGFIAVVENSGHLALGSQRRLDVFNPDSQSWRSIDLKNDLVTLVEDGINVVWVTRDLENKTGKQMFKTTWKKLQRDSVTPTSMPIRDLAQHPNDRKIWMLGPVGELLSVQRRGGGLDNNSFQTGDEPPDLTKAILIEPIGDQWLVVSGGSVYRYENTRWEKLSINGIEQANLEDPQLTTRSTDGEHTVWRISRSLHHRTASFPPASRRGWREPEGPLRDAAQIGDRWGFLFGQMLHILDPRTLKWNQFNMDSDDAVFQTMGSERVCWSPSKRVGVLGNGTVFHWPKGTQLALGNRSDRGQVWRLDPAKGELLHQSGGGKDPQSVDKGGAFRLDAPAGAPPSLYLGTRRLGRAAIVGEPRPTPPLDAGWLSWDRSRKAFKVKGPDATRSVRPSEFFTKNGLAVLNFTSILAKWDDWLGVTQNGILHFSEPAFRIDHRDTRFEWTRLKPGAVAWRGGLAAGGTYHTIEPGKPVRPGGKTPTKQGRYKRIIGDIGAVPDIHVNGKSAIGKSGFQWDAFTGFKLNADRVFLRTPMGTRPAGSADLVEPRDTLPPLPPDIPFLGGTWKRTSGGVQLTGPGGQILDPFAPFSLIDAIATGEHLLLLTKAGLHAPRLPASGTALESSLPIPAPPGARRLVSLSRKALSPRIQVERADGQATKGWLPGGSAWFEETATDQRGKFRVGPVEFHLSRSGVRQELWRIKDGRHGTIPCRWVNGTFPHHVVTDITAHRDAIFAASDVGVEDIKNGIIYDPGTPVRRIWSTPKGLHAETPSGDVQTFANDRWRRSSFTPPTREPRVQTTNWEWIRNGQTLTGNYIDETGNRSKPIRLIQAQNDPGAIPQFPHDQIIDLAWHRGLGLDRGRGFTLLANGWIARDNAPHPSVRWHWEHQTLQNVSGHDPVALYSDLDPEAGTSLILEGKDGGLLDFQRDPGGDTFRWLPLRARQLPGIRERRDGQWAYTSPNLRLSPVRPNAPPTFEILDGSGVWHSLPWSNNICALDQWELITGEGFNTWAATAAGLLHLPAYRRGMRGFAGGFRAYPTDQPITDLRQDGNWLLLRFDHRSDAVWRVPADPGAVNPTYKRIPENQDPFREALLIKSGEVPWTWHRKGAVGGSKGALIATFDGQPLSLNGGQFPFDEINSIAFTRPRIFDFAAQGGWYTSTNETLKLAHIRLAKQTDVESTEISRVVRATDGALGLVRRNDALRLLPGGQLQQTDACPEWQHDDPLWRSIRETDGLRVTTRSGTLVERELSNDGSFLDQICTGLPIELPGGGERLDTASVPADELAPTFLLPTSAGILQLDAALQPLSFHPRAAPVAHLGLDPDGKPIVVSTNNLQQLDTGDLLFQLPNADTLNTLNTAPDGRQRLAWQSESTTRLRRLVDPGRAPLPYDRLFPLNAAEQSRPGLGASIVGFRADDRNAIFEIPGSRTAHTLRVARPEQAIRRAIPIGERLYILSSDNLTEIDLPQARAAAIEAALQP